VVQEPEDSGIEAVSNLLVSIQRGNLPNAFTRNLVPMLRGSSDVLRLLWFSKALGRRAVSMRAVVRLKIEMEQAATASNRIRLSDNLDALGLRKAIVDWRVGDAENLYVVSCAVYPSGGSSNPTFTLMALAMRLGDHLRSMVAGSARHAVNESLLV
jgi:hypothetical protein